MQNSFKANLIVDSKQDYSMINHPTLFTSVLKGKFVSFYRSKDRSFEKLFLRFLVQHGVCRIFARVAMDGNRFQKKGRGDESETSM